MSLKIPALICGLLIGVAACDGGSGSVATAPETTAAIATSAIPAPTQSVATSPTAPGTTIGGPQQSTSAALATTTPSLPVESTTTVGSAPLEDVTVFGLAAGGVVSIDPTSLATAPLVDQPEQQDRALLELISPESFLLSAGIEPSGFVSCDARVIRVDAGQAVAALPGFSSAAYSSSHDLVAAIGLREYYTEDQCVGGSLVIMDPNLEVLYDVELSSGDGIPPVVKSVDWLPTGEVLVVLDQVFDLVDEYSPWRSDLVMYAMTTDGPARTAVVRPAVDEVWTGVFVSGSQVVLSSSTASRSVVRQIAAEALPSALVNEDDWEDVGDPRAFDGFVFSAVTLPGGELLVSVLGERAEEDVVVAPSSGATAVAGVSGLALFTP